MATLVGVAVDVSGSMKSSARYSGNQQGWSWARSIFNVIDGLIKHDVSSSNHVFALGFGGSSEPVAFDLLNTIKKASSKSSSLSKTEILEQILSILECNGAPRVRKWAKMNVLHEVVEHSDASLTLDALKDDPSFRNRFVYECLPESCRRLEHSVSSYATEGLFSAAGMLGLGEVLDFATRESVKDVMTKGLKLLQTCVSIGPNAIMDVHTASEILHGCIGHGYIGQADLTDKRVDELMKTVERFIYGCTPLMETLSEAKNLFAMSKFKHDNKLLFILSNGQPTDGNDPPVRELSALGVTTVCCYITNSDIDDPKCLYSTESSSWDDAAKLMFRMSSTIETQLVPRTIFLKRGWTIDITNNETRLFVQVNHPDIIEDVCDLARCCMLPRCVV